MSRLPPWLWAAGLLAAVLLFNLLTLPGFFSFEIRDGRLFGSLVDVLNRAAPVLLLSLGMTLVIATGGVDLSVGAIMAISGAVAATLLARPEGSPLLWLDIHHSPTGVVVVALAAAIACGYANGLLVSRLDLQPIVATLLLMVAGRGLAQLIADGQIVTFHSGGFTAISSGSFAMLPNPVWIVVLMTLLIGGVTRRTALGLFIEATGSNAVAARQVGLNSRAVRAAVYTVSGLTAGIAGLIATADIKGADANNVGLYLELDAILAVSVGGTALTGGRFSLVGSVVGALLMQTLTTTLLTRGVSPDLTLVLKALVVTLACLVQSQAFWTALRRPFREAA